MGMSKRKQEEEKRGCMTAKRVEEDKGTLWIAFKGGDYEYGRVDNKMGGSDIGGVQGVRIQRDEDRGE